MDNNLKILGTLEDSKKEVADNLAQSFRRKYPSVEGEMYLGYPIYHDEVTGRKVCVDIALISKIGVFIINILNMPVTDYGEIQDIVNAQKCVNTLQRRTDRNALFTAITRSKGWVRVFGYGEDMQTLCDEFEKIREHDFKLYFEHYPTKAEQETIFLNNQDVEGRDKRAFDQTKELINRLSQEGSISKVQLMKQLFDADIEELLQLLRESENE